jgi:hypothetical protein
VFFNDAHILNLTTFTWHSLTGHGVVPAGRYGHSLTPFGNRLIMFGGVNNGQVCAPPFSPSHSSRVSVVFGRLWQGFRVVWA